MEKEYNLKHHGINMKIQRTKDGPICEECAREFPESPLQSTTLIDNRYLCDVHADDEINKDLYDEADEDYFNNPWED